MQSIEITTTQNVTIEYELARLLDRIFAFIIDSFILWGSILILSLMVASFNPMMEEIMYFLILGPIVMFYSLASEMFLDGQTIGKKALGIKVVKLNGKQPTLNDYLLRWVFRSIDIWFSFGTLGSLFIGSSAKGQRLGDLIANTTVIKVRSEFSLKLADILKISTLSNHEVTYPAVRQFSEKDMLLIKTVISRYQRYPNDAHRDTVRQTVSHMMEKLNVDKRPVNSVKFLKTLISDYIVLTR